MAKLVIPSATHLPNTVGQVCDVTISIDSRSASFKALCIEERFISPVVEALPEGSIVKVAHSYEYHFETMGEF